MQNLIADINNPAVHSLVGGTVEGGQRAFGTYLRNFIALGIGIGAAVFLFMLILGGINYITAGGDKEAISRATKRISNALIGLIILFSIYIIINLVGFIFGINVLQFVIPKIE